MVHDRLLSCHPTIAAIGVSSPTKQVLRHEYTFGNLERASGRNGTNRCDAS
jgi:hypothetical protein